MFDLKIAYIGGGSRNWARTLMNDLASCPDLNGQVMLYDLDFESACLMKNWPGSSGRSRRRSQNGALWLSTKSRRPSKARTW